MFLPECPKYKSHNERNNKPSFPTVPDNVYFWRNDPVILVSPTHHAWPSFKGVKTQETLDFTSTPNLPVHTAASMS